MTLYEMPDFGHNCCCLHVSHLHGYRQTKLPNERILSTPAHRSNLRHPRYLMCASSAPGPGLRLKKKLLKGKALKIINYGKILILILARVLSFCSLSLSLATTVCCACNCKFTFKHSISASKISNLC